MNRGYVLDRAGVEAINRAISRVGNTPPAMLDTNRRHRITVTEGGGYEYNGYFKITDASKDDAFKVKVADGATGGASTCKVNNKVFSVPAWTSEAITASKVVALKYTAASGDAAASVAVELFDELPDDSDTAAYCQIGRVIVSGETRTIQQDHTTGVAQIWWYLLCSEVV